MKDDDTNLPAEIEALCRAPIVHNGQRVVTTDQLARFYGTDAGNITDNLNRNQDRFTEGVHFVKLAGAELKAFKNQTAPSGLVGARASHLILWLEPGALRHAKLAETEKAWDVFGQLEDAYFEMASRPAVALPDFTNPIAAARAWADQVEARQIAEKTKAQIGSRREATAMNAASQAAKQVQRLEIALDQSQDYATVKRMQAAYPGQKFNYHLLRRRSSDLGRIVKKVPDVNYGEVNAYHADVWQDVYGLAIPSMEIAA